MGNINFISLALAVLAFGLSGFITHKRATNPSGMKRLEALKSLFGDAFGSRAHWLVYVVLPFLMGIMFTINGLRGRGPF